MKSILFLIFICLAGLGHAQFNIDSVSHISYQQLHGANLNDVWGYEDEFGNEYAIVGTSKGTSIVDITNPSSPVEVFWLPGSESIWRDPSVHGDYAYVSTEADDGLLIIDLSPLPASVNLPTVYYTGPVGQTWTSAHTCFCDENGFVYVFGSNRGNGGVIMLDVNNNPMMPEEVGTFDTWYCHDGYVRNDTMYLAHIYDGIFSLVDVTDKSNPILLGTQGSPSNFTHNIWPSQNGQFVFTTDEVSGAYIGVYDISNPASCIEVERIQNSPGAGVIPHNTHVKGDYIITSYYSDGIVIHDATFPNNLIKVGQFDTYPGQTIGYDGCWGVYPFFNSGTIIAADITEGLFILNPQYLKGSYLIGNVIDNASSLPLNGVKVTIFGNDQQDFSNVLGDYATGVFQTGNVSVLYEKVGYFPFQTNVSLIQGQQVVQNVQLIPIPPFNLQVNVTDGVSGLPIYDVQLKLVHTLIEHSGITNAIGEENFILYYQENYKIYAGKWGYKTTCTEQIIDQNTGILSLQLFTGYYDDFEFDFGWSIAGTANTGQWERGKPNTTSSGSVVNGDVPWDCGTHCYVTGNNPNLHPDFDDVDEGTAILISPIMDLTTFSDPYFNFGRGFYCNYGPQLIDDTLKIYANNGIQTVLIDQIGAPQPNAMQWEYKSIGLNGLLTITPNMQLMATISDFDPNVNVTEAAIDEFYVSEGSLANIQENVNPLNLYPNPAGSYVKVNGLDPKLKFYIYDITGRIIFQSTSKEDSIVLDVSNWQMGFYWIQQNENYIQFLKHTP